MTSKLHWSPGTQGHVWPRQVLDTYKEFMHNPWALLPNAEVAGLHNPLGHQRWWWLLTRPVTTEPPQIEKHTNTLKPLCHVKWPGSATQTECTKGTRELQGLLHPIHFHGPKRLATESPKAWKPGRTEAKVPINCPSDIQRPEQAYVCFVPSWNTINKLGTRLTGKHHVLAHFLFWSQPKANYNKWPMSKLYLWQSLLRERKKPSSKQMRKYP